MKIAILTMTFNNNYGGYLQAYALMQILKKLGHEPKLLFVQPKNNDCITFLKKYFKKFILSYITTKWKNERYKQIIEKNTKYFSENYIVPKTEPIYSVSDFKKYKNQFDAYIVGSDQVWRPTMYKYINQAFLDFVENPKAILLSYAASFGLEKWEYTNEQTKKFKKDISKFKSISVREDSGVILCKENFEVKALHVLDPTMLLEIEDYRKIVKQENEPNFKGGLLSYFLDNDEEKQYLENIVASKFGLKSYNVNVKSNKSNAKLEEQIYPTVTSWIKGFDDAKYVVTDSFHGCVFSILFNKPFLVYGNKKRGMARFNSLLKMFELEDRLVLKSEDINEKIIQENINWVKVNKILDNYKNISKNFLIDNLKLG
ncbi:polysaccharide pyruvyl transferase family protein [Halarcobacter anaerophilus]|uniref:MurB family protein n=1 Tax=Halarcobacter anaerophilus TaxID=877500 RepID=A0A4Q0Y528_9BACT|nr:polysaccharide pyruvyl transferase family protein [Halarcobacter anaerophilus]QDF29516.1 polysaccharide pyruvyl transferase [Halarcobacter anaerophilus]RXJ64755.1 MurB family protein [Halarcobacter anaerophilus]